jgi:thioredoxin reductase
MCDVIIIGGGPAGLTAAAYALHKRLETLVIAEDLGGKINYGFHVPWIEGYEMIAGAEIVNRFKSQLQYLNFAHELDRVVQVVAADKKYAVLTQQQKRFETRAVIVATGTTAKRLDVPGERRLIGRGLSYSAMSHAPLFIEHTAALVGQGAQAMRGAAELALAAKKVYLVLPDPQDLQTPLGRKLQDDPKVEVLTGYQVKEILGDEYVKGMVLQQGSQTREIALGGLFVEMGLSPNSQMVAGLVALSAARRIVVDARGATNRAGIFAAGDVTDTFAEQVLVAIGDGAKAALSAYEYLLGP